MKLKIIDEVFFQNLEQLDIYLKDNVAGAFGGNHRSKKIGSSSEFADYRKYVPGDDIRRIDWNVFSRFDKLYLKLFLEQHQCVSRYITYAISENTIAKSATDSHNPTTMIY